jgi:hypothetical protein
MEKHLGVGVSYGLGKGLWDGGYLLEVRDVKGLGYLRAGLFDAGENGKRSHLGQRLAEKHRSAVYPAPSRLGVYH